jgi:hypothetical protein
VGNGCGAWGYENLFPTTLLCNLHPSRKYVREVTASAVFLLTGAGIIESDAHAIIDDAERANVP